MTTAARSRTSTIVGARRELDLRLLARTTDVISNAMTAEKIFMTTAECRRIAKRLLANGLLTEGDQRPEVMRDGSL